MKKNDCLIYICLGVLDKSDDVQKAFTSLVGRQDEVTYYMDRIKV